MSNKQFKSSELKERKERQRTQLLLNVVIVAIVLIAWAVGKFTTSVTSSSLVCLLLIIFVFTIWHRKSSHLLEQIIKAEELRVHRRKALRNEETAEWLNFILNRWWNFSEASLFQIFKMNLDPVFEYTKPAFVDTMEVVEFTFGGHTPCVKFIKAFEGSRNKASREELKENNADVEELGSHLLVLDLDLVMSAPDASVVIRVRLGGKFVGAEVDVAVEDVSISGRVQMVMQLNHTVPFPHIKGVSITFLEKPDVAFDVRMLKGLQVMDIPMVKDFINSLVMESLTVALVDPEQIYIPLHEVEGDRLNTTTNAAYAVGVLSVSVSPGVDDNISEVVWLTLKLGDQEKIVELKNTDVEKNKSFSFLVYDLKSEKCTIEIKGKRSLGTKYTIAKHKLPLKKLNLENTPETSTVLEKPGVKGSRLDVSLVYTELQHIEVRNQSQQEFVEEYNINGTVDDVSGVVLVLVHSGSSLLPMDSDGLSDPYCIITANKRMVKTTEHVPNTVNPTWESLVEFPVDDITQIMLSFLVYDRDNNWQSKSDDFMGSCNVSLSLDNAVIIRQEVELLYKVFGGKNSEDTVMKAGSICLSVVFRPVASVAQSETSHFSPFDGVNDGEDLPGVNINGKPHTAKTMSKTRKEVEEMLLLRKRGALVMSILQASDLVAMDNNGLSDPFCVILVDDEKKYKTEVIKESLKPVWNESCSMPMLTEDETLCINVFDKDVIKNDFMGKVTLTVVDILKAAENETPVWFSLDDIESGKIQLSFRINSTDNQIALLTETTTKVDLPDVNANIAESAADSLTEIDEENAAKIPAVLYKFAGEIIQADTIEDCDSVAVKVKVEIPRKGRLRGSLRSKIESFVLLKTDAVSTNQGKVQWDKVFQTTDGLAIPKESLFLIELITNGKKSSLKFSYTLEDLLKGDVKFSKEEGYYTWTKWVSIPSDENVTARLQIMLTFSDASNVAVPACKTKRS